MGMGLLIAGGVAAAKSVLVRPAVTATTGGTANVAVSMVEDFVSFGYPCCQLSYPVVIAANICLITAWIIYRWRHSFRWQVAIVAYSVK